MLYNLDLLVLHTLEKASKPFKLNNKWNESWAALEKSGRRPPKVDSNYNWLLEPQFKNHFSGTCRNQLSLYISTIFLRLWNNITPRQCGQSIFIYRLVLKLNGDHFLFFFLLVMLIQLPRVHSVHSCIYHTLNRHLSNVYSVECIIQTLLYDHPKKNLEPSSEYYYQTAVLWSERQ